MNADPRELRGRADALRRAADRLTILRLRLANSLVDATRVEDPSLRERVQGLHERWTLEQYPQMGRIARRLRSSAKQLDAVAVAAERSSGRRLGGYAGAGFLGRGDEAHRHVADVVAFVGTAHGASIGGFPLRPGAEEDPPVHPSHTLGTETPDYDEQA